MFMDLLYDALNAVERYNTDSETYFDNALTKNLIIQSGTSGFINDSSNFK
jgi:hypothetical protein